MDTALGLVGDVLTHDHELVLVSGLRLDRAAVA